MQTRARYAAQAEHLARLAHAAEPAIASMLAAEAQVYATLATAAPDRGDAEVLALRRAVAELLHDADTSADSQAAEVLTRFREGLPDTAHGEPVLTLAAELMATDPALHDDVPAVAPNRGDADGAQATLAAAREVTRRLAAHAAAFQDVLDEGDRWAWGKLIGADLAALQTTLGTAPAGA